MVEAEKVQADILAEKVKAYEAELKTFREKEESQKIAAEQAKSEELKTQLSKQQEELEAMKVSFEEKLNKVSQRQTTPNSDENSDKLTVEKLQAMTEQERVPYFTQALKAGKNMDGVFF